MTAARLLIVALAIIIAVPCEALASGCANPIGTAGDQFYNNVYNVMQYCNGTTWVNMGTNAGGGITTLSTNNFCSSTDGLNVSCTISEPLTGTYGGTGVNNGSNTLTLGGNVTYSGAHTVTWTTTGTTNLTLPSGTNTLETTALASGDIWVGSGSSVATAQALSGDCTLSNAGAITCTKTSGTAFGTLATATTPLSVANGGTGLSAGTSGGVLYYSGTGTLASSGALTQYEVVLGGGAGAAPVVVSGTGTSGQVLTSTGSSSAPTWQTASGGSLPSLASGDIWIGSASSVATATALPLSVANGGTGVSLSTGTGKVVLSASPTLTGTAVANIIEDSTGTLLLELTSNYMEATTASSSSSAFLGYNTASNSYYCYIGYQNAYSLNCYGPTAGVSDARLKKDFRAVDPASSLDGIMKIHPVIYKWRSTKANIDNSKDEFGFTAQDIEKVFPLLVGETEQQPQTKSPLVDGKIKVLEYDRLIVPAIAAIQQLKADNDNLRAGLKAANNNTDELRREVEELRREVHPQ